MPSAVTFVPRSVGTCWRVFTDASAFAAWLPGLRKARVLSTDERGLPREIHFELTSSRTYSLVYAYDEARHEVRWEPQLGKRDAVRGSVRFEPVEGGTRVVYELEPGLATAPPGAPPDERLGAHVDEVVDAFAAWVLAQRPSVHVALNG